MKYAYSIGLYITEGVIEAEDETDAEHRAKEYAADQFSDALSQADFWCKLAPDQTVAAANA